MIETLKKDKSIKLNNSLSLIVHDFEKNVESVNKQKTVSTATSHIIMLDVSGSMYDSIKEIKTALKNKLPSLLNDDDNVSIIYFSDSDECGVLMEEVPLKNLKDVTKVNQSIDKFLNAMSLTCFTSPLKLAKDLITKIKSTNKDKTVSLFFVSDGHSNTGGTKTDILDLCNELAPLINSSVVFGWGYYCDKNLLQSMSESLGGQSLSGEDFNDYEPVFESYITDKKISSKKIQVTLEYKALNNIAYSLSATDNSVTVYSVNQENNTILVPEDLVSVNYFTRDNNDSTSIDELSIRQLNTLDEFSQTMLSGVYVLSTKMLSSEVSSVLSSLGDIELIDMYSNSFGKQNINQFNNYVLEKLSGKSQIFKNGANRNYAPKTDAYCLLNLLDDLMNDGDAKIYPRHESFVYERTTSKTKQKDSMLNEQEQEQINELNLEISKTKDIDKLKELNLKLQDILNSKTKLEFIHNEKNPACSINSLVWNEDRPNLSMSVTYYGKVVLPSNEFNIKEVDTKIIRNYLIVKDATIHIPVLPVSLSKDTFTKIQSEGLIDSSEFWQDGKIFEIKLKTSDKKLFVINKDLADTTVSSNDLFPKIWELTKLQASQKVFKFYESENFDKQEIGLKEKYGEEASKWLSDLGIKDYGFSPPVTKVKSGDVLEGVIEFPIKISSYSTLPSVNAVNKKITSGKTLTPSENLLAQYIKEYDDFITSEIYIKSVNPKKLLEVWLKDKSNFAKNLTKDLIKEISKIKFKMIVSQSFLSDAQEYGNFSKTVNIDGNDLKFTATIEDKTIEI